jgi:suppressor of G2 allele of SKP1
MTDEAAPPSFPVRTDTYQTAKTCAVVLYTKGHQVANLVTHPETDSLTIEMEIDGTPAVKAWKFFGNVDPASIKVSAGRATTEITLAKASPGNWARVEADAAELAKLYERWSQMKAPKEEEEKNDDLDHFFQKIYKDASPEAQRAMMKSFTESQGTVLSTNWEDIGNRHVDPQPPKD